MMKMLIKECEEIRVHTAGELILFYQIDEIIVTMLNSRV